MTATAPKFTREDLTIPGTGSYLNPALVHAMELDAVAIEKLKESHVARFRIHEAMSSTKDVAELRNLAQEHDELEFAQQELWGFDKNPHFHQWYSVPQCSCPKRINHVLIGTGGRRRVSSDCIIHGDGWMPLPKTGAVVGAIVASKN